MERLAFSRPPAWVRMNLVAAALFGVLSMVYLAVSKWLFGLGALVVAVLWVRRYLWARSSPYLEIDGGAITAHLSASRHRSVPLSEVASVEEEETEIVLVLRDGSRIPLPKAQIPAARKAELIAEIERYRPLRGHPQPPR